MSAHVLLNVFNKLRKSNKSVRLSITRILSLFLNLYNKFNKTCAFLAFYRFSSTCLINSIKHYHECEILLFADMISCLTKQFSLPA